MHKTRRGGGRDTQEKVRIRHGNGPGLLGVSRRRRYVKAEMVLNIQIRMGGDIEVRNECVRSTCYCSAKFGGVITIQQVHLSLAALIVS